MRRWACATEELGELIISIGNSKDALAVFRKATAVRLRLADERGDDRVRLDVAQPQVDRCSARDNWRSTRGHGVLRRGTGHHRTAEADRRNDRAHLPRRRQDPPCRRLALPPDGQGGRVGEMARASRARSSRRGSPPVPVGSSSPADKRSRRLLAGSAATRLQDHSALLGGSSESLAAQYQALEVQQKLAVEDPDDPALQSGACAHPIQHRSAAPEPGALPMPSGSFAGVRGRSSV